MPEFIAKLYARSGGVVDSRVSEAYYRDRDIDIH